MFFLLENEIPFLKGHMGGNEIVLVPRSMLGEGSELALGLKLLERPYVGGDQLGMLYQEAKGAGLSSKIVDINSRDYLPICGGMTQVLGKAHRDTNIAELFELDLPGPQEDLYLETDIGTFTIRTDSTGRVTTIMDSFLDLVYDQGIERGRIDGILCYRIGNYLVTFEGEIRKEHPGASFCPLDQKTGEILMGLQKAFGREFNRRGENRDFALMGEPEKKSHAGRLIFPHNLSAGLVEQTCGTGTIAVAMALVERGIVTDNGEQELMFESGGDRNYLGGPELTTVKLESSSGRVKKARFSHDRVEIIASGKLFF